MHKPRRLGWILSFMLLAACFSPVSSQANGQFNGTFNFDEQHLWATGTTQPDLLVGMAFDPSGRMWTSDDRTARLRRFGTLYSTAHSGTILHSSPDLHVADLLGPNYSATDSIIVNLVNDPLGTANMYGIGPRGVYRYSTFNGAKNLGPYLPVGTYGEIAIAASPNGDIYFTVQRKSSGAWEVWKVNNALTTGSFICTVPASDNMDAIVLDPTGQFLFLALDAVNKIRVFNVNGTFLQDVPTAQPNPDGLAFHDCGDPYLLSNNNNGTINRFDFPNGYGGGGVVQSVMASGGFRGDFVAVHAGYLYATQWTSGSFPNATRYDDGTLSPVPSVVQIGRCFSSPDSLCTHTPPGMTDWWPLDEALPGPTTTADIIGKYPGTLHGAITSIAGVSGLAFHFPATAPPAYVDCGPICGNFAIGGSSATQPTGAFSIDAWVKLDQPHNTCAVIVDKHIGSSSYFGYQFQVTSSGFLQFVMGTGGAPTAATSNKPLSTGWNHVVVTVGPSVWIANSSPPAVKYSCALYLNGSLVGGAQTPFFSTASLSSTANFTIGGGTGSCAFGGAIDEVELFDRILVDKEIGALSMMPKCRCHVEMCKLQQVDESDNLRETKFKICNDGGAPQFISWTITGVPAGSDPSCTKDGSAILQFSPSSGTTLVGAHQCVTVAVQVTLTPFVLLSQADVACYQVKTDLCGPNGVGTGSFMGPIVDCVANVDTCFSIHRGWGNIPIGWTIANNGPIARDFSWFVKETGAEGDSLYPVSSLGGQSPGLPTPSAMVHVPGNGSAYVSVPVWMFGSQAQHPTHLQLYLSAVGDTTPAQAVADLSMASDEASGSRYSGWATASSQPALPWSYDGSMIFDRAHERLVVLGGIGGCCYQGHPYLITGVGWFSTAGDTSGTFGTFGSEPPPLTGHSAIYDPVRQRMLVFGGRTSYDGAPHDDEVYAMELTGGPNAGWSILATNGSRPAARFGHTAIYDPVGDRMIVSGGLTSPQDTVGDTWALALGGGTPTWSQLPTNPIAQASQAAVYDPVGHRMITFGGTRNAGNQLFALSLNGSPAWTALQPLGEAPPSLERCAAYMDSATGTLAILGGAHVEQFQIPTYNAEVWSLSLAGGGAWSRTAPYGGSPLSACAGLSGPGLSIGGFDYMVGGEQSGNPVTGFPLLYALPSVRGDAAGGSIPVGVPSRPSPMRLALRIGPNPFRATTVFTISVPGRERVTVGIYDVAGRQITRIDAGLHGPGEFNLPWTGKDGSGHAVHSGVYLVRVRAGNQVENGRVIRIN